MQDMATSTHKVNTKTEKMSIEEKKKKEEKRRIKNKKRQADVRRLFFCFFCLFSAYVECRRCWGAQRARAASVRCCARHCIA